MRDWVKVKNIWVYSPDARFFPENWGNAGYISNLEFSHAMKDYKGKENKKLELSTLWEYDDSSEGPAHWKMYLKRQDNSVLDEIQFAGIKGNFADYNSDKLEDWQRYAWKKHCYFENELRIIFHQGKIIPKIFFDPEDFFA